MLNMTKTEEDELLKALEDGSIEIEKPTTEFLSVLKQAGENTFKKDRRINIRLSSHDLLGIQMKAVKKGIPYQALIAGIIHQYVEGDLVERS